MTKMGNFERITISVLGVEQYHSNYTHHSPSPLTFILNLRSLRYLKEK